MIWINQNTITTALITVEDRDISAQPTLSDSESDGCLLLSIQEDMALYCSNNYSMNLFLQQDKDAKPAKYDAHHWLKPSDGDISTIQDIRTSVDPLL